MSRVIVCHGAYGCDTGCCGHWVEVLDEEGEPTERKFTFSHCGDPPRTTATIDEKKEFARRLVLEKFGADHVADLDWDNCIIDDGCWQ